jgi:hypothetical protein
VGEWTEKEAKMSKDVNFGVSMVLTENEAKLIREMREKDKQEQQHRKVILEVLLTAYEYERWLRKEGSESTYSTFCDDFGFGADCKVFELVESVRQHTKRITS